MNRLERQFYDKQTWLDRLRDVAFARWWSIKAAVGQRYRRARGITRLMVPGCECAACGQRAAMHRAGCRCWPMSNPDALGKPPYVMAYGYVVESGAFMRNEQLREMVSAGRHVEDFDGRRITLDQIKSDDP